MSIYKSDHGDFHEAVARPTFLELKNAPIVAPDFWQGVSVKGKIDMQTREILNHTSSIWLDVFPHEDVIEGLQAMFSPDLPWCDDHFEERVCGWPINPGVEWANWRLGAGADKFRDGNGMFNHNYMERIWPKFAGHFGPMKTAEEAEEYDQRCRETQSEPPPTYRINGGIRKPYGDLNDLVWLLRTNPLARQAFLPMFFPEDTGSTDRTPCTLGWHFIRRNDKLHMVYYLRSCDAVNHWRNDLYMAARLLHWVLDKLRSLDPDNWTRVTMGTLTTHITSLHAFRGQEHLLEGLAK